MDEIDRLNEKEKSQKQKEQWRNYVEDSLKHPLDNRYSSQVVQDHINKENEEMTKDPVGYERRHTPKSTLPLGNKDELDDQGNIREIISEDWKRNPLKNVHHSLEERDLPLVDDNTSREELDMLRRPLEKEEVTNPKHYNERKMEPLDYIIANELDFLEGNIVKYITRYTYKGGVNDLLKARTYLEKLIERERDGR
jgi:hypothetical protein